MGILRSDLIAHSQLTSANASVLFNGSDAAGGNTGLKTADVGNTYELMADIGGLTIECWINCTSTTTTFDTIWATNNYGVSGNGGILYQHNDGLYMSVSNMSDLSVTGLFETDTWYHVASVREWVADLSLYEWRLYVDGVMVGSATASTSVTEDVLCIGSSNYGSGWPHWSFAGYISNFRMCRKALYRENFTPSKFKLKNVPGTVLLCCQDASSATAVTVGDTLTSGGSPPVSAFGPDLKEDNTDTGVIFEDNTKFDTLSYMVPPGGTTSERGRGRGVFGGGESPSSDNVMEYLNIQSGGRTVDFGDTSITTPTSPAVSSSTRGVFKLWNTPANLNTLQYITIATTGNSADFGDVINGIEQQGTASNATRGLFAGGLYPGSQAHNPVEYITIATTGNGTDFGDLSGTVTGLDGTADTTRAVFAGGIGPGSPWPTLDTIEYFTIATTGNATDFGNLNYSARNPGSTGDSTRGVWMGGTTPSLTNTIDYVTIQTTGNATDFGDLVTASADIGATSNSIRGIMGAGVTPSRVNTIEQIIIQTKSNALDFGDLIRAVSQLGACSDSHGGIS